MHCSCLLRWPWSTWRVFVLTVRSIVMEKMRYGQLFKPLQGLFSVATWANCRSRWSTRPKRGLETLGRPPTIWQEALCWIGAKSLEAWGAAGLQSLHSQGGLCRILYGVGARQLWVPWGGHNRNCSPTTTTCWPSTCMPQVSESLLHENGVGVTCLQKTSKDQWSAQIRLRFLLHVVRYGVLGT